MFVFSNEWMSEILNQEVGFSMTRDNKKDIEFDDLDDVYI